MNNILTGLPCKCPDASSNPVSDGIKGVVNIDFAGAGTEEGSKDFPLVSMISVSPSFVWAAFCNVSLSTTS